MYDLLESMRVHQEIPLTFDGEIPEFAFGESAATRLIIGKKYGIPGADGKLVEGVLQSAIVNEARSEATGIYRLNDGKQLMATSPLTPNELAAFKRHPDTFFGAHLKQGRKVESPLDLFDFMFESYKDTPKEKLFEFMKTHPNIASLRKMPQTELAILYCELMAESVARAAHRDTHASGALTDA
jgi:hypothetical protein